ncbi:MAG: LPS assembly protein LptD [Porticoccaceae bacterium]|nr:LPS assembly protein LptD [Porticoccaceae bacterium]
MTAHADVIPKETIVTDSTEIPNQTSLAPVNTLDWVKKEHMTPEQQALVAKFCCGAYLEPERDYQDADKHPDESPLRVNALTTEAQSDSIAILEGDVNIAQGYRQIRSNSAIVDQKNRLITLIGNVRFREPNMLLTGNHALLNLDSEEVKIDSPTYVLHQASIRGSAKLLRRNSDGLIIIEDSSFTGCEPEVNTWKLQTSEISLDQKSGFATVKNARLDIGKVPVFYFPYAKFPISDRRSSGLLFPNISNDQENGIDFSQPIYWNLAPNYDVTITPRYIQHRGIGIETKFRHINGWSSNQVTAGFLANDKGGKHDYQPDSSSGLYPNQGDDRYIFRLQHQGNFAKSWSSLVDFNQVSDTNYYSDIDQVTENENNPTHLRRFGSLGYQDDNWQFSVESQDYQSIIAGLNDPYRIASKLTLNGIFRYSNSVVIGINNQQTEFNHDSPKMVSGGRTSLHYNLGWDKRWSWGYLNPTISLRHLDYQLDSPQNGTSNLADITSITVPTISLDGGITFEKDSLLLSGYKQTLEPRLFYVNSEFREQQSLPDFDTTQITPSYSQLFRENRFVGGDRISDDHRLSLGLSTSLVNKDSGYEKLRASIAQAIYFDDRKVSLSNKIQHRPTLERKKSDLAFELFFRINNNWRLKNEAVYNNQDKFWEKTAASLYYRNQDKLFNISYRYSKLESELYIETATEPPIEQLDMSFYIPTSNDFSWVGRWHHDFTNNRELEVFSGFEYNNCCWRAGLVVRRWLDRKSENLMREPELRNGVFLQIQFKGIAGTSGRVASILKKGIYGYEPLENF